MERPVIVCLCGSTRFSEAFHAANLRETLAGKIVLTIGCDFKSDEGLGLDEADKARLDALHLRKIELADEVYFLNVGGYMGHSTLIEHFYAACIGKCMRYLEAPTDPNRYYLAALAIGKPWLREQAAQGGRYAGGIRNVNRRAWFPEDKGIVAVRDPVGSISRYIEKN